MSAQPVCSTCGTINSDGHAVTCPQHPNNRQVGGDHYKSNAAANGLQHWDVVDLFQLDYFQGNVSKYLFRWRHKNGLEDLEKARHYLDKYIDLERARQAAAEPGRGYVKQG